ncbi:arsenite-resistance protein 2 containing protein [Aphelenchoides avenae]|nr:arsenite-resistance protein 2 containing protein [Aphelenchus avenae]
MKRNFGGRREDEPTGKRNRFDSAADSYEPQFVRKEESSTPVMLTFKKFLATQDESITDEEAIAKYNDYKLEFKRQECEKFFQAHKDEEWFRLKYHPGESKDIKAEHAEFVRKRVEVFTELVEKGWLDRVHLDYDCAADIIRLMDAAVTKLEGGTDEDLEALKTEEIDDESVLDLAKAKEADSSKTADSSSEAAVVENGGTDVKPTVKQENGNGEAVATNGDGEKSPKKKTQLHKTSSIFFRNIPVTATLADIENICKQHPGYLRIGLSEPIPEQKFLRRGWVTFRRDVNIKEIFWQLKSARIGDCDLGATVNRDLKRRVRTTNGIAAHRQVTQNDVRQAAKLIALYDHKEKLFLPDGAEENQPLGDLELAITKSTNPVLKGAVDYLVEEASAEEEELLGATTQPEEDIKFPLEEDKGMTKFLDKLLAYLRIVHSIDFYNHGEYPNEDKMPNRIGMIFVRGPRPDGAQFGKNDAGVPLLSKTFVENFINGFNQRLETHLLKTKVLSEEELIKLGKKDEDKAVEDFVQANCVELAKEKWLCPLSGKKFKGPEFIRKHLESKHQERLDQVRHEALYFNNFIFDPDRPHNPEPKAPVQPPATAVSSTTSVALDDRREGGGGDRGGFRSNWNDRGGGRYGGGNRGFVGGGRDFNRPRYFDASGDNARRDPRQPTSYRDLDAPEEIF